MEITYSLREKDFLAGQRFIRKVVPAIKRQKTLTRVIVASMPCIVFLLRWQLTIFSFIQMLFEIMIWFLFLEIFVLIFEPVFDRQRLAALSKQKNNGVLGEHKLCLTEQELVESTSVNESHHKWAGVEGVYENQAYILIVVKGVGGHIIPKRAFVSDEAANQFYNQARIYYENAQSSEQ